MFRIKVKNIIVFIFVIVIGFTNTVKGTRAGVSSDPVYYSADSSSDRSEGKGEVGIDIPVESGQLDIEPFEEPSIITKNCLKDAGYAVLAVGGVLVGLFTIIGIPALVTLLPASTPLCADICASSPGYYAPLQGTPQYAYVYCNGTTDGVPRKRGGVVVAAVVAASHGARKSTAKPRQLYKDGWICEEAALSKTSTTFLETLSTIDTRTTSTLPHTHDDLPPLVNATTDME